MTKDLMKFWATCPGCKREFGISPDLILKYVDRFINGLEGNINRAAKKIGYYANREIKDTAEG